MTVTTTSPPFEYVGNGSQTVFPIPFSVTAGADMVVLLETGVGTNLYTVQTSPTNYTFSGTPTGGPYAENDSSITMVVAPASGRKLRLSRATPVNQTTAFPTAAFNPKAFEFAIDRVVRIVQDAIATLGRALTVPITSGGAFSGSFIPVALNYLRINASATGIELVPFNSILSGGVADGTYGDVTVSGSGATWNLNPDTVTTTELANNAVETANILDTAVTLPKLATTMQVIDRFRVSGTDLQTFNSAAALQWTMTDAGSLLRRIGGVDRFFREGKGFELVNTTLGAPASTIEFTSIFSSDFDNYLIEFRNLAITGATDVWMGLQFYIGGSFKTSAGAYLASVEVPGADLFNTTATDLRIHADGANNGLTSAATSLCVGAFDLFNASSGSLLTTVRGTLTSEDTLGDEGAVFFWGQEVAAGVATGFRFLLESPAQFAAGTTIRVYGRRN